MRHPYSTFNYPLAALAHTPATFVSRHLSLHIKSKIYHLVQLNTSFLTYLLFLTTTNTAFITDINGSCISNVQQHVPLTFTQYQFPLCTHDAALGCSISVQFTNITIKQPPRNHINTYNNSLTPAQCTLHQP